MIVSMKPLTVLCTCGVLCFLLELCRACNMWSHVFLKAATIRAHAIWACCLQECRTFRITWFYCRVTMQWCHPAVTMQWCHPAVLFYDENNLSLSLAQYVCFEDKLSEQTQSPTMYVCRCILYTCTCMQLGHSMPVLSVVWVVRACVHDFSMEGAFGSLTWSTNRACQHTSLWAGTSKEFSRILYTSNTVYLLQLIREDLLWQSGHIRNDTSWKLLGYCSRVVELPVEL